VRPRPDAAAGDVEAASAPAAPEHGAVARRVAVGVGGLAVLLAAIDAYVVVSIFETILNGLGLPINHLERATPIVTGYLLGYVAGMPLLARVSDRYGRRLVIYVGLAGFAVGSALTGWSAWLGTNHPVSFLGFLGSNPAEQWLIVGRTLQGLAGGALLPVTLALAADLVAEHSRARVLGGVGAAQELGSVLGPLYGAWVATFASWKWIFWINIPLAVGAAMLVHLAVPSRRRQLAGRDDSRRPRVDVVGGLLLAGCLAVLVTALNNQHPDVSVLPPNGMLLLAVGGGLFVLFLVWEVFARTKLMEMDQVAKRQFFGSILTSFCAGAALLVTLVFVQLDAQSVLDKSAGQAALLLARFLISLPIGAVLGGFLVRRFGERLVTVTGLLIAAFAYWLISRWPIEMLAARHNLGPIHLPVLDTDLGLAGLGLGLVIAPLSSAVLRAVPAESHGIASAGLVVARMMGMLLGVSAIAAWGLHKFNVLTAHLNTPLPIGVDDATYQKQLDTYTTELHKALQQEYRSIFLLIVFVCVIGALIGLTLDGRRAEAGTTMEAAPAI
jgi:MFS family permease